MAKNRYILIILVISVVVCFVGLGKMALTDPDETFYAQTAKEMFQDKEWITPHIFDQPQFEKPIFYYWLILISYMIFGITEFAARFPSAIFAIFGILGIYYLAKELYDKKTAFISSLIMITSVEYIALGRGCVTDMVLGVTILFCLMFFVLGWNREKRKYYYYASIMAALAVLTKGPIGLFIPGMILFLYILFAREWNKFKTIPIAKMIFIFSLVSGPWYYVIIKLHGDAFLNEFLGFHNVVRFLEPEHKIGSSPYFYIPIVIAGFFPWSAFLPCAIRDAYKRRTRNIKFKSKELFFLIWFLLIFIFFSISRTKLITYIFPLFPVLAIITGAYIKDKIYSDKVQKSFLVSFYALIVFCVVASIAGPIVALIEYPTSFLGAAISALVFLLGTIIAFVFLRKKQLFKSICTIMISFVLLTVLVNNLALPIIGEEESKRNLSLILKEQIKPNELVGGEDDHRRGIAYYLDKRDIIDIHPYNDLKKYFSGNQKMWGIIQYKHYVQLKGDMPDNVSEPIAQNGKHVLINNKPMK